MGAYSRLQFYRSGFNSDDYKYSEVDGTFDATLDCKKWGKESNVLGFFTLENGQKIIAAAWQRDNYLGIPEIEVNTEVTVTFKKTKTGKCYLTEVDVR